MKEMSFLAAMRDYFGFREGEGLAQFNQEIKALSLEERAWFRENLWKVGYKVPAL